jgi:hypothetical protein
MHMRERPYGGWLWILDMVTHEVSGFFRRSMGCMGLGLGKISGGAGESFLVTLDLRWIMAPKLDFGMTRGEGIKASRLVFRTYSVLPNLRKLPWHTIWISLVPLINEMLTFLEQLIIGRWISLLILQFVVFLKVGIVVRTTVVEYLPREGCSMFRSCSYVLVPLKN